MKLKKLLIIHSGILRFPSHSAEPVEHVEALDLLRLDVMVDRLARPRLLELVVEALARVERRKRDHLGRACARSSARRKREETVLTIEETGETEETVNNSLRQ